MIAPSVVPCPMFGCLGALLDPAKWHQPIDAGPAWPRKVNSVRPSPGFHITQDTATKEERRLTHLASLLLPLRRCTVPDKKGRQPLAAHLVAHEIKWKAKDAEHTARLHQQAPELLRIARALQVTGQASVALSSKASNLDPEILICLLLPVAKHRVHLCQLELLQCHSVCPGARHHHGLASLSANSACMICLVFDSDAILDGNSRTLLVNRGTSCAWSSPMPSGSSKSDGGSAASWLPYCRCGHAPCLSGFTSFYTEAAAHG